MPLTDDLGGRNAHIYGIDLADTKELVAYGRSEAEVSEIIGADAVIFQTLPDLISSCHSLNPTIKNFEHGVFSGEYVTPVDENYFSELEEARGETAKLKRKEAAITAVAAGVASPGDIKTVLQDVKGVKVHENGEHVEERMDISIHNIGDFKS